MKLLNFLLVFSLFVFNARAEIFDTVNNFVTNGDAEQNWTAWLRSANTSLSSDSVDYGQSSFQLNPDADTHSDIRTHSIASGPNNIYLLKYYYKSLPDSDIEPGSSFVAVRSFDANDNFLGQQSFEFEDTNGQWIQYQHEIETLQGCRKIDIWFIANGFASQSTTGQFRIDNINLYRFIPSLSRNIGSAPDQVYVIKKSVLNDPELILMQTLQGLTAQTKPEIWIDRGDMTLLDDMAENYGITYTRVDSLFWYLNRYKDKIDGYILYDLNDKPSITAANSLASIMNALMVDISLKSYMDSQGYSQVFDARGKNDAWVYDNYWNRFNRDAIIARTDDISLHPAAYYFRDWGVAIKSLFWWNSDQTKSKQVYDSVIGNAPIYGWTDGTTADEMESIAFHSKSGLYQIPADSLLNLSTLAGMAKINKPWDFNQPISDNEYTKEQGVHYLAFKMSDMDNILTLLTAGNFRDDEKYFGNPNRGNFAMGWGMPPSLTEIAPSAVELWYRDATEKDGFSAPTSGTGYTYPHLWPENELKANMIKLEHQMKKADLKTVIISDNLWPQALNQETYGNVAEKFARLDQVRGIFYLDVNGDYARYGREADAQRAKRIYWFNQKPFVPCRYTLWDHEQYEGISRTALQLANTVNSLPTDPQNPASYTFVMVHAWSFENPMDEVAACVANLDSDVRVVTPDEMIKQIRMNFLPCNDDQPDVDLNDDCNVNFKDLKILADQWFKQFPEKADFNDDGKVNFKDFSSFAYRWLD